MNINNNLINDKEKNILNSNLILNKYLIEINPDGDCLFASALRGLLGKLEISNSNPFSFLEMDREEYGLGGLVKLLKQVPKEVSKNLPKGAADDLSSDDAKQILKFVTDNDDSLPDLTTLIAAFNSSFPIEL